MDDTEIINVETIAPSALAIVEKAQIDMQIETAHRFPRKLDQFKSRAISLATIDEETAASCIYRRPVGKKPGGQVEYAEGMSIRTAEIVGASYGNLRVAARIIERDERHVVAQGVAHDLESNFLSTSEVIESTVTKDGKPYSERMRITIAKAALAKARRDATFQVVPKALCKPVEKAVREVLTGNQKTMDDRRSAVVTWVSKLNIDTERVWRALGIGGPSDIGPAELETLTGLKTSIQDGDTSIDDAFPKIEKSKIESGDMLEKKQEPKDAPSKPEEEPTKPELPDVDTMSKSKVKEEIMHHMREPYFTDVSDRTLGAGNPIEGSAISNLRECLKALREEAKK